MAISLLVSCLMGCGGLPTLDEQVRMVARGDLRYHELTAQAVRMQWGAPTYSARRRVQFFPRTVGNWVPDFRVPPGEYPKDWDLSMVFGEGVFLAYVDREEVLGFYEERLVYREHLSPQEIHVLGKQWARESLYKTRIEGEVK